jgi:glucuronokinase
MAKFANFVDITKKALVGGNQMEAIDLIDENFNLRRKLYGDLLIGEDTLMIINIARAHGHAAKLSGSGGCVIGCSRKKDPKEISSSIRKLKIELEKNGLVFCELSFSN